MKTPTHYETDFVHLATWLDWVSFPYSNEEYALIQRTLDKAFTFEAVSTQDKYELRCLYFQAIGFLRATK